MIDNQIKKEYIELKNKKEYYKAFSILWDSFWNLAYEVCNLYECKSEGIRTNQISDAIDKLIEENIIDKKYEIYFAIGLNEYILETSDEEEILDALQDLEVYFKNMVELYNKKR